MMVPFLFALIVFFMIDLYFGFSVLLRDTNRKYFSVSAVYVIFEFTLFLWALTLIQRV